MSMGEKFANSGELVASTLRGYRSWKLSTDRRNKLYAVSMDTEWESKNIIADCVGNQSVWWTSGDQHSDVPLATCTCGIYGWYEPENALSLHTGAVVGVVEFSGRILMGSVGFRAEKARIVGIAPGSRGDWAAVRKSIRILETIEEYVTAQAGVGIEYKKIQSILQEKEKYEATYFIDILKSVAKNYDVECFPTVEDMKAAYPPQLDTVENVIGSKLRKVGPNNGYTVF